MSKALRTIFPVILSLFVSFGRPSSAAQQAQPDESVKLGVELIVMDVQVLEKDSARPLGGLKREDFAELRITVGKGGLPPVFFMKRDAGRAGASPPFPTCDPE